MKPDIRIIFMGTPDFSVPALKRLAKDDRFDVCLVVTQPDRPKGRGKKMSASPVKEAALSLGIEVFQPPTLKSNEAVLKLSSLQPDFFVVTAFGQILTQQVLDIPRYYPINIHASLLPRYRGASPIQSAILNMDKQTGVTTMVMAREMDAGDILLSTSTAIHEQDTAQILHDRLGKMGADLIVQTLEKVMDNQLEPIPQDHSKASYVKLIRKKDGRIDWTRSNKQIIAHINAMNPWPGAFTDLESHRIKIFKAQADDTKTPHEPGTVFECNDSGIYVSTGAGSLIILELMGVSGKRLLAKEYLRGKPINPMSRFDF